VCKEVKQIKDTEEKLKHMLDEQAMNIQASINDVSKEVKQIKHEVKQIKHEVKQIKHEVIRSWWLWLCGVGIAIIAIGGSMISSATTTPDKIQDGLVLVVGLVLVFAGLKKSQKVQGASNHEDTNTRIPK